MKALAAVFVALQLLAALALAALSVHGPSGLAAGAALYVALAIVVTLWIARRAKGWGPLAGVGLLTLAAAPGLFLALDFAEQTLEARRIRGTQVTDVSDEPILAAGKPIGVRVRMSTVVPATGHFAIFPWLYAGREGDTGRLEARSWTFDGRPGPEMGPFLAGTSHRLVFDLYPTRVYALKGGGLCLLPATAAASAQPAIPAPLRVEVYQTPYRGRTQNGYDIGTLHENALSADFPLCK